MNERKFADPSLLFGAHTFISLAILLLLSTNAVALVSDTTARNLALGACVTFLFLLILTAVMIVWRGIAMSRIEAEEYLAELDVEMEEKAIRIQSQQALTYTAIQAAKLERQHIIQALQDTPPKTSVEEAIMVIRDLGEIHFNTDIQ